MPKDDASDRRPTLFVSVIFSITAYEARATYDGLTKIESTLTLPHTPPHPSNRGPNLAGSGGGHPSANCFRGPMHGGRDLLPWRSPLSRAKAGQVKAENRTLVLSLNNVHA